MFLLLKVDLSELLDPLNARGGPVKLYRPAMSYISICWGPVDPICAEKRRFELNKWLLRRMRKAKSEILIWFSASGQHHHIPTRSSGRFNLFLGSSAPSAQCQGFRDSTGIQRMAMGPQAYSLRWTRLSQCSNDN